MIKERNKLLEKVSREAGACLNTFFGRKLTIRKKGELDLVTEADETVERLVVEAISATFPNDSILAEEGSSKSGDSGFKWIIDPLDGTTNFAHELPQFSVSIALAQEGRVISGVVFDPIKDEYFAAHLGEGATLNGQPIHIGVREQLGEALGVSGFSYNRRERMEELLERTRRILMHCQGFRRLGSAALDLAYVACGRFDVYLEDGLNAWDIAAGQLLVREAGGVVSLLNGESLVLERGQILATNESLQQQALKFLC